MATTAVEKEVIVSGIVEDAGIGIGVRFVACDTSKSNIFPIKQVWELFQEKMKAAGLSEAAMDAFKMNYEQLVAGVSGLVREGWLNGIQ
jgi:hypothetical protein